MDKRGTLVGTSAVAGAILGAGLVVDRRRTGWRVATPTAGALAAAYLAGTYLPSGSVFGKVAKPHPEAGDDRFALTFDDGPDPAHTPAISELLAGRGHQATFFVLGRAARAHPELILQLAAHGHEIACHGDDHRLLAFATPATIAAQLTAWDEAIHSALGRSGMHLLRAPHGVRSPWLVSIARRHGYPVCGWDGSVFDTAEPGVETIVGRVEPLLRPGAVVLLHDGDGSGRGASRRQTVEALPAILDLADLRGLRSARLSSLIGTPPSRTSMAV